MSTNETLRRLADQRRNTWEQAKAILDRAETDKRELTAEEDAAFQRASNDMTALADRIKTVDLAERQSQEISETLERALGTDRNLGTPSSKLSAAVLIRSFARGLRRGGAMELDIPATGNAVANAREALRTGHQLADVEARTTLNKTTSTAGGVLLQTTLYGQIVQHLVASSAILTAGATVIETAGAAPFDVPITTSHGSVSALTAEGGNLATNSTDPAFSKRTLTGYKYGQLVQVARELLEDELFDIIPYIASATGRNVGLALGSDLLVGNGSSKPSGVLQTSTLGVTGSNSVSGVFTADNLIDLMSSVIAPYRASASCAWVVLDATLGSLRKLKDGASRYLFDPAAGGIAGVGMPDRLLGKPVYTDPYVPAQATSAKSVIFGAIDAYWARLAGGVRFERSDDFAFGTDLVTFKTVIRGDGVLVDQTGAVKHFIGGSS